MLKKDVEDMIQYWPDVTSSGDNWYKFVDQRAEETSMRYSVRDPIDQSQVSAD